MEEKVKTIITEKSGIFISIEKIKTKGQSRYYVNFKCKNNHIQKKTD